jgi:hypothetical protein
MMVVAVYAKESGIIKQHVVPYGNSYCNHEQSPPHEETYAGVETTHAGWLSFSSQDHLELDGENARSCG